MKSVFFILSLLPLAHYAMASSCSSIPQYTTSLEPACTGNDTTILWPNYMNFTQYYMCQGAGNPVLVNCSVDTYFSFYLQICTTCDRFIPAPACEYLLTENAVICVPIQSSTTAAPAETPNTPTAPAPTENPNIPIYNTTFIPACEDNDLALLWPNYENFSEFYKCKEVGIAEIDNCAADTYFSFYLQVCTPIDNFLPAPACENLRTQSPPVCTAIGSTTLAPTEQPTDEPTESTTDATTENSTDAPTEQTTGKPTDATTEDPTEKPTDAPTEEPTEKPTDNPTDAPTEVTTAVPTIPTPPVIG